LLDLDTVQAQDLRVVSGAVPELLYAYLIVGKPETLRRFEHRLPVDIASANRNGFELDGWLMAHETWKQTQRGFKEDEEQDWAAEVAWRLIRSYELRQNHTEKDRYDREIEGLLPKSLNGDWFSQRDLKNVRQDGTKKEAQKELQRELQNLRRCAFPSILELLQRGFERVSDKHKPVALTDGLPDWALEQRLVSLSYQHRMHPDISAFPREQFYTEQGVSQPYNFHEARAVQLLQDAAGMAQRRSADWSYARYAKRAIWLEVEPPRRRRGRGNENAAEVEVAITELEAFVDWAAGHPRRDEDGKEQPWEVAMLTFYRAQEKLLRDKLQRLSRALGNTRNFKLPAGGSAVHVTLCTVDRFQGHEADLVLLSFVKSGTVGFLNSPNRLNVALTRARYQLVLIGHRTFFASDRHGSELLRSLANSEHYKSGIAY